MTISYHQKARTVVGFFCTRDEYKKLHPEFDRAGVTHRVAPEVHIDSDGICTPVPYGTMKCLFVRVWMAHVMKAEKIASKVLAAEMTA